jgi:hypothetical protein
MTWYQFASFLCPGFELYTSSMSSNGNVTTLGLNYTSMTGGIPWVLAYNLFAGQDKDIQSPIPKPLPPWKEAAPSVIATAVGFGHTGAYHCEAVWHAILKHLFAMRVPILVPNLPTILTLHTGCPWKRPSLPGVAALRQELDEDQDTAVGLWVEEFFSYWAVKSKKHSKALPNVRFAITGGTLTHKIRSRCDSDDVESICQDMLSFLTTMPRNFLDSKNQRKSRNSLARAVILETQWKDDIYPRVLASAPLKHMMYLIGSEIRNSPAFKNFRCFYKLPLQSSYIPPPLDSATIVNAKIDLERQNTFLHVDKLINMVIKGVSKRGMGGVVIDEDTQRWRKNKQGKEVLIEKVMCDPRVLRRIKDLHGVLYSVVDEDFVVLKKKVAGVPFTAPEYKGSVKPSKSKPVGGVVWNKPSEKEFKAHYDRPAKPRNDNGDEIEGEDIEEDEEEDGTGKGKGKGRQRGPNRRAAQDGASDDEDLGSDSDAEREAGSNDGEQMQDTFDLDAEGEDEEPSTMDVDDDAAAEDAAEQEIADRLMQTWRARQIQAQQDSSQMQGQIAGPSQAQQFGEASDEEEEDVMPVRQRGRTGRVARSIVSSEHGDEEESRRSPVMRNNFRIIKDSDSGQDADKSNSEHGDQSGLEEGQVVEMKDDERILKAATDGSVGKTVEVGHELAPVDSGEDNDRSEPEQGCENGQETSHKPPVVAEKSDEDKDQSDPAGPSSDEAAEIGGVELPAQHDSEDNDKSGDEILPPPPPPASDSSAEEISSSDSAPQPNQLAGGVAGLSDDPIESGPGSEDGLKVPASDLQSMDLEELDKVADNGGMQSSDEIIPDSQDIEMGLSDVDAALMEAVSASEGSSRKRSINDMYSEDEEGDAHEGGAAKKPKTT